MSVECSVMVREVRGSYDWSQCKLFRRLASITGLVLSGGSYRSQLCWALPRIIHERRQLEVGPSDQGLERLVRAASCQSDEERVPR